MLPGGEDQALPHWIVPTEEEEARKEHQQANDDSQTKRTETLCRGKHRDVGDDRAIENRAQGRRPGMQKQGACDNLGEPDELVVCASAVERIEEIALRRLGTPIGKTMVSDFGQTGSNETDRESQPCKQGKKVE